MGLAIRKRDCMDFSKTKKKEKIKTITTKGKIKIGSIVFFRSRKWKYVGNKRDKCKLVLLENEKPVKFDKGYVTETNTAMCNLVLIQSA